MAKLEREMEKALYVPSEEEEEMAAHLPSSSMLFSSHWKILPPSSATPPLHIYTHKRQALCHSLKIP